MAAYSITDFQRSIRAAIRAGWAGALSRSDVINAMDSALNRGLQAAWAEGSRECSVLPNEYTPDEKAALALMIYQQMSFVTGLADAIAAESKANKGKLEPLLARGQRWVAQWDKAKSNGKASACKDKKAKFRNGNTRKHCRTCGGLAGRVYRYSTFIANNAVPPKNPHFECGAVSYCQCYLEDTDEPITKGRFPRGLLAR